MIKILKYIIFSIIIMIWIYHSTDLFTYYDIPGTTEIRSESMHIQSWWDPVNHIKNIWFNILWTIKLILEWLLVIFIVYVWAQMIYSMWSDEENLSKAKRQLRYSIVALLFINMPGSLYNTFHKQDHETLWQASNVNWFQWWNTNLFFDWFNFGYTFWDQVVWFLEVMIFAIAVIIIIYEWLKLISSRWREERVTEAKNKIVYSILALVFVWIIEAWKTFAFDFKVSRVTNIFWELADLALFFAGPIAFFFLTLAAYYYITSAWDEEKVKKAKSIVINTILATLILLASYTFLIDLAAL
jgi:hypothetical protein